MSIKWLTVPINEKGIYEYDHGVQGTPNLHEYTLDAKEMDDLAEAGVFAYINDKCNLMIDDYESEIIPSESLKKCFEEIKKYPGTFLKAAEDAIKQHTFLALDF